MKVDQRDLLIYFIFLLLALIFFYPFLTGSNILSFRDLSLYFYPLRFLMVEMVKSGQLPLWNPYIFCGYPLMATLQVGFFYPFSLLYYILPFNLAFNYYTIIHYFLAASFMFMLMRHFGLSRSSSFLSGMVFAFSGYLLSMANMNTTLTSVTWLPLLVLVWDRVISPHPPSSSPRGRGGEEGVRGVLFLSILLALMFLGGEPTILYVTLWFLVFYALVFSQKRMKSLAFLFFALLIAVGLTAVQLLPFLEVAMNSLRVTKTDFGFIAFKSFPPREMINFILPFFFGNLVKDGSYTRMLVGDLHQVWLLSPYLGILPLIFAFLSFKKISFKIVFFWMTAIISLLMAFGKFTPFYGFFFHFLPGVSLIRYPVKYIFLAIFSLSVLCGFGYENIQEVIEKNKENLGKLTFCLGLIFIIMGAIYLWANANQAKIFLYFRSFYPPDLHPYFVGLLWKIINFDLYSLSNLVIFLFLGLSLFYLTQKGIFGKGVFNFLMIIIMLIDLAANNIGINPPGAYEILRKATPNIKELQKDKGIYRFYAAPPFGVRPLVLKIHGESLFQIKDNLMPNWIVPYRIASLLGRESMEPKELTEFYRKNQEDLLSKQRNFLDMANVKYVHAFRPVEGMTLLRKKDLQGMKLYLYRNPQVLPRAYIRDSLSSVQMQEGSRSEIVKYRENEVVVKARLKKDGYLFLSDTFYPGWRVFVDGREEEIIRADNLFRAVSLKTGEHGIVFVYDPLSFKLGALISMLSLLAIIGGTVFNFLRGQVSLKPS